MILQLLVLQLAIADTVTIRPLVAAATMDGTASAAEYGAPQLHVRTGQGDADVWLARAGDTVYFAARIPDSTVYWGDDIVLSLDPRGTGGARPDGDDFQWYLRRVADSSVVYHGRAGRWMPPRDDPDWRLGGDRSGEGWRIAVAGDSLGWSVELALDAGWLAGESGRAPRLAVRLYDDAPHGWYAWPSARHGERATVVEATPSRWAVVAP